MAASQGIPVTADDVDFDFDATASPPPGARGRSLSAGPDYGDPGHITTPEEWAEIVAHAQAVQRGDQP